MDHEHDDHGSHGHGHGHGHGHAHAHAHADHRFAFAFGMALNLAFVVLEVAYGVLSHSMALIADAGHNLSDVLGLGLAWGASLLARRAPTKERTYGLRSTTMLASLVNAVVLLVVTGGIAWESLRRLIGHTTEPVAGETVIVVALVGVAVNGSSALLFFSGRRDLNVRSAFLHLASDAVLALGVAAAGTIILFTGWHWLDPVVSIVLAITILAGTWSLLKSALNLVLHAVPAGIDADRVRAYLASLGGVSEVHDLHIWPMSTTETALTAHLVVTDEARDPALVTRACEALHHDFGIEHVTLQVEAPGAAAPCPQAPEWTV